MHNNILQKSANVFSRETQSDIIKINLSIINSLIQRTTLLSSVLSILREVMASQSARSVFDTRLLYPEKKFLRETQHSRHRFFDFATCIDAIVECTIWLAGARVLWSRLRLRPDVSTPVGSNRALGGHEGRRRKVEVVAHRTYRPKSRTQLSKERLPPYLPSSATTETAAAVGSDTISKGGIVRWGSLGARLRPVRATHIPFVRFVRGERIFEIRTRNPRKISRWFTIRAAAELSRSSARNGLCL